MAELQTKLVRLCLEQYPTTFYRVYVHGALTSEDQKILGNCLEPDARSKVLGCIELTLKERARLFNVFNANGVPVDIEPSLACELKKGPRLTPAPSSSSTTSPLSTRLLHMIVNKNRPAFKDLYLSQQLEEHRKDLAGAVSLSVIAQAFDGDQDFIQTVLGDQAEHDRRLSEFLQYIRSSEEHDLSLAWNVEAQSEMERTCTICSKPFYEMDTRYPALCRRHYLHREHANNMTDWHCNFCRRQWETSQTLDDYKRNARQLFKAEMASCLGGVRHRPEDLRLVADELTQMLDLGLFPTRSQSGIHGNDIQERQFVAFVVLNEGPVDPQQFFSELKNRSEGANVQVCGVDMGSDERLSGSDEGGYSRRSCDRTSPSHQSADDWTYSKPRGKLQKMQDDKVFANEVLRGAGSLYLEVMANDWESEGRVLECVIEVARAARK